MGRAHCGACKDRIAKGVLRFGTKTEVQEHVGIAWRHLRCVTKRQASNLHNLARSTNNSIDEFLVVPPSVHAGGDGPETEVVRLFLRYIAALESGDTQESTNLLTALNTHHKPPPPSENLQHEYAKDAMNTHELDIQAKQDFALLELMSVSDVRALCDHHGLSKEGTKFSLIRALESYYRTHKGDQEVDRAQSPSPKRQKRDADDEVAEEAGEEVPEKAGKEAGEEVGKEAGKEVGEVGQELGVDKENIAGLVASAIDAVTKVEGAKGGPKKTIKVTVEMEIGGEMGEGKKTAAASPSPSKPGVAANSKSKRKR